MKSYIELDVWLASRKLVKMIYDASKLFPKEEIYGLTSQIRRCAVSIPANIAEGHGRSTSKDRVHFFYIARGSLYELETEIYLANDLNFIEDETSLEIQQQITSCKKLLNGLIRYIESR